MSRIALLIATISAAAMSSTCSKSESKEASATQQNVAAAPATPGTQILCEHGVLADLCTKCTPELEAVFKAQGDWCNEHGVPESQCKQCNPRLDFSAQGQAAAVQAKEPICREHGVPEAMCTKCKPQLVAKFVEAGNFCREHGLPESVCPYCHPELARAAGIEPPTFPPPGTTVRFAKDTIEARAGIQTERAAEAAFSEAIDVVGQLEFNQNRLARLSARHEALVTEVEVDVGDEVKAGQQLVLLTSGGVGGAQGRLSATKARLEAAEATLMREEQLLARGISSRREVDEARAQLAAAQGEHQAAQAELRAAGAGSTGSGGYYALSAPFAGDVVNRNAVAGMTALPDEVLIEVADLSTVWAMLDVPEEVAMRVRPRQKVTLRFESGIYEDIVAEVSRVAASVDKQTRTVRVRVDVANDKRTLKAGLFLRARIELAGAEKAILLPRDAVQRAEGHDLVFVRTSEGVYEPKTVQVRAAPEGRVAVTRGLDAGAEVVTVGAFLLKTEILKDSIGAGCADGD